MPKHDILETCEHSIANQNELVAQGSDSPGIPIVGEQLVSPSPVSVAILQVQKAADLPEGPARVAPLVSATLPLGLTGPDASPGGAQGRSEGHRPEGYSMEGHG